jgi:hypothetical protein
VHNYEPRKSPFEPRKNKKGHPGRVAAEGCVDVKLDILCIRDILLCVEEHTDYRNVAKFVDIEEARRIGVTVNVPEYNHALYNLYDMDKVLYHIDYCIGAGLLVDVETERSSYIFTIADLTPLGHETVNDMRDSKIAKKIGTIKSASLPVLLHVAKELSSSAVKSFLGLS